MRRVSHHGRLGSTRREDEDGFERSLSTLLLLARRTIARIEEDPLLDGFLPSDAAASAYLSVARQVFGQPSMFHSDSDLAAGWDVLERLVWAQTRLDIHRAGIASRSDR